ncbi:MAG: protein kinase [Chloroflexi bacterium]|nr:protein kinase [Chloroflexota bacterium]
MDETTLTGRTIGKYHIEERLGRGGMAEVYKGYQENLDRYVAIKVMHPFLITEEDFLHRFKREARAMASIGHPNIVRVIDFDVYGQHSYYLVMEYIDGGTLKEKLQAMIAAGERMPLEASVKMITDVADALTYAHRRGMVHRDIKPANIMLRKESGQAVLTDFGIVKMVGDQSLAYTATGALIGTPSYMSPEQALGKRGDERVDIYSLGVLLFQMITNQLPFAADTPLAVVMKHVNEPTPMPVTFNPDIPLDLQNVVIKAMEKEPKDRFQSAAEMAAALRAVNMSGPKATTVPIIPPTQKPIADTTAAGATMAAQTAVVHSASATAVNLPVDPTVVVPPEETSSRKPPIALLIGGAVLLLFIIGSILWATGIIGGGRTVSEPTTVPAEIVSETETDTPTPTDESTDAPPDEEPDEAATRLAQLVIALTEEAAATDTPTPESDDTPTAVATPTVDATAEFLATCIEGAEIVSATRGTTNATGVFADVSFTIRWVLRNSGTCPWPDDLVWEYVEEESFGYEDGPIPVETIVNPDNEVTLLADVRSPDSAGTYESTWQLMQSDGVPFGEPLTFSFLVVPRATSTPAASPTPLVTPTPTAGAVQGNAEFIFTVGTCDYPGDGPDWRCPVTITPYIDGSDEVGSFTVFVFDLPGGQAVEYRGTGPFTHFVKARRCAAYNQGVRVIDDVTGTEVGRNIYIDPDVYFPGGCTE